jgi:hypothetical protein
MDFNIFNFKYIFLLLILLISTIIVYSQNVPSNLEYSRVITKTFSLTGSKASQFDTVPVGKVWKLESIIHSNYSSMMQQSLEINTFNFPIPSIYYTYGNEYVKNNITPIWLKTGDIIRIISTNQNTTNFFYSIIEYTEK